MQKLSYILCSFIFGVNVLFGQTFIYDDEPIRVCAGGIGEMPDSLFFSFSINKALTGQDYLEFSVGYENKTDKDTIAPPYFDFRLNGKKIKTKLSKKSSTRACWGDLIILPDKQMTKDLFFTLKIGHNKKKINKAYFNFLSQNATEIGFCTSDSMFVKLSQKDTLNSKSMIILQKNQKKDVIYVDTAKHISGVPFGLEGYCYLSWDIDDWESYSKDMFVCGDTVPKMLMLPSEKNATVVIPLQFCNERCTEFMNIGAIVDYFEIEKNVKKRIALGITYFPKYELVNGLR